jgi:hypothetical protein
MALFSDNGWDPYLEDAGTLWLIHWHLASQADAATTWWWVFNQFPGTRFMRRDIQLHLERLVAQLSLSRVSPASLKRDIDCFIRTYAPSRRSRHLQEDTLDCPLIELGLLREESDQSYSLVRASQPSLPLAIFGYALAVYLARRAAPTLTVSLNELAYAAGAPGRVFCLNESGLLNRLEALGALTDGSLVYDETAGLKQILLHKPLLPRELLKDYYAKSQKGRPWQVAARTAKR